MPLTTIYGGSPSTRIIGSASSIQQSLHPDVMAYINVMQSPSGGNYAMSLSEIDAVNQLVCSLETNGLWAKMDLVYPFIGNSLSAMKYNLKNTSQYNIAFTGTAFTLSTANGFAKTATDTTSYGSIPFNVRNLLSGSSNHISCYLGTSQAGIVTPFGSYSSTVEAFRILSSTGFFGVQLGSSSGNINLAVTGTTGYIIGSRTNLSNASMYVGGVVRVNNTTTVPSTNLPNFANIGLGMSLSGTAYPSTQAIRFATIGSGLTDIEAKNLSTIVQIYQTKLSRQV